MYKVKDSNEVVTFEDILEVVSTYIKSEDSIALISKAYDFIMDKHSDQKRKSGEPYTNHLLWVAYILATLQTGPMTIAAGLLHDVMEDCDITTEQMTDLFGEEITSLVEGVTKISNMPYKDESEMSAENHRKIYIAMAKDIRVILIKFADRLHNMRTLNFLPEYKQKRIAKETLEVYSPIAHRLGINDLCIELEDLSLMYIDRTAFDDIANLLEAKRNERKEFVDKMVTEIERLLKLNNVDYTILGRAKHIYSIYKKMVVKNKRFDELYDLNAIRIITKDKIACYEVLGIIHEYYRPLPGRFKDYIAMPKPNMYQSLHTAVIGENGLIFEIQIRTEEMDLISERGVAAHWRYKENKGYSSRKEQEEIGEKLQWLRDFITLSEESQDADAKEYYNTLRHDIFEANVYVLSPQGKIIELPNGSTPIDFAYRIHSEVGHRMVGALVNNMMVPIGTKLKTGDVVAIKTNKNSSGPSEDWLKIIRTASARNKIRQFIAKKEYETKKSSIEDGKKLLREEVKRRDINDKDYMEAKTYDGILSSFGCNHFDDLLFMIGKKRLTAFAIIEKLKPTKTGFIDNLTKMLQKNTATQAKSVGDSGVVVNGVTGLKIQLSNCCNPIPGDDIIGFISKGKGIKVHLRDCPNVQAPDIKKRLIDVYWDYSSIEAKRFVVDLEVTANDRMNLITDVITFLGQQKINILNFHGDVVDNSAIMKLKISVESAEQLEIAKANLMKIQGVYEIERIIH